MHLLQEFKKYTVALIISEFDFVDLWHGFQTHLIVPWRRNNLYPNRKASAIFNKLQQRYKQNNQFGW